MISQTQKRNRNAKYRMKMRDLNNEFKKETGLPIWVIQQYTIPYLKENKGVLDELIKLYSKDIWKSKK